MTAPAPGRLLDPVLRVARGLGVAVSLAGLLSLGGWIGASRTIALAASPPAMKPNTAAAFVLAGLALWLLADPVLGPRRRVLSLGCAWCVAIIGLATLGEALLDVDLGIDQLAFRVDGAGAGDAGSSRMAVATAFGLALVGVALVLSDVARGQAEERLRQREATLLREVQAAPVAMVVVDSQGRLVEINEQAERLFGYCSPELVGAPLETLVPERFRERHRALVAGYVGSPRPHAPGTGPVATARRKDGSEFSADIALSPIQTADGLRVMAAIIETTDRQRLREALGARSRQQEVVAVLGQRAQSSLDTLGLMREAVTAAVGTLDLDFAVVLELDADGRRLRMRAFEGTGEAFAPEDLFEVTAGSQPAYVLASSSPVVIEDLKLETRFDPVGKLLDCGARSGISTRLQAQRRVYGILGCYNRRARRFAPEDAWFVASLASILGGAVERGRREGGDV